jgi:hypothetical protein
LRGVIPARFNRKLFYTRINSLLRAVWIFKLDGESTTGMELWQQLISTWLVGEMDIGCDMYIFPSTTQYHETREVTTLSFTIRVQGWIPFAFSEV